MSEVYELCKMLDERSIEPRFALRQDGDSYLIEMEYTGETIGAIALRMAKHIEDEVSQKALARLGYVKVVRCRDCKYATLDHADHDYRETLYCDFHRMDVSPDRYCAWGMRKEEHE